MPSRASSRSDNLETSSDIRHGSEVKTSRQYQKSRFAKEKPRSPRSGHSLKFKDKVKADNPIRPPHSGVPVEFVRDDNCGFVFQSKSSGNQGTTGVLSKEEELVKYMSKVPGFLHKGAEVQDNVLNFGVLDWGRLEKWTNKQNRAPVSESADRSASGICSTSRNGLSVASGTANGETCLGEQHTRSQTKSAHNVDCSPVVKPLSGKALNHPDMVSSLNCSLDDKKKVRRDRPLSRDGVELKSAKGKEKYSDRGSGFVSKHGHRLSETSKKKVSTPDREPEKYAESKHYSGKQEGIVLLLPKDFSRAGSSEVPSTASVDGKSAELNWGSFSDIFSVDEIQSDESLSDISHSFPLPYTAETETELDMKLDNLIKTQDIELSDDPPDMSLCSNDNGSTVLEALRGLDQRAPSFSADMTNDGSAPHRFSFSLSRLTKSLSFKEGSGHPQLRLSSMTAKSGPAKPDSSVDWGTSKSHKANTTGRTRNSTFRRLLDPLLKNKVANQTRETPNDLRTKPAADERCEASTVKALLHLTVKSGLPLFKFVVETRDEILASTVKSLSIFGKNDSKWLYTFYSVNQVRKKSGGWKNYKVKDCGFSYNVIGQMKVSNPRVPSWCEKKSCEQYLVKELILYSIDLSKEESKPSEATTGRELTAIVVKMPNDGLKDGSNVTGCFPDDRFSSFEEDEILGSTVVILPGGFHSLPNEGVPSSLINRWRSGGLCDCGGWDVGCKLRILTNSKSVSMHSRCDLFEQGGVKQRGPMFTLIPFRDGLFSVEFYAEISSLQAFSICVALINSQKLADCSYATNEIFQGEGPEKHAPHPPLSPVGRV